MSCRLEPFLNVRSATAPSPSPDGHQIAFLSNLSGLPQAWAVPAESGWPRRLTFTSDPVRQVAWSPTGEWILYAMDRAGDEQQQLYLVRPDGTETTALTANPAAVHAFGAWSPDGRQVSYAGNTRDPRYFDVWVRDVVSGEARCVVEHDGSNFAGEFSPAGDRLLFRRATGNFQEALLVVDLATGAVTEITPPGAEAVYRHATWTPDGQAIWLLTDLAAEYVYAARLDLATGSLDKCYAAPWDLETLAARDDGTLAFAVNESGRSRLVILDTTGERTLRDLPTGVVGGLQFTADGRRLVFHLGGAAVPADVWAADVATGATWQVTCSDRGGLPATAFREPEAVRYPTFDGRPIPAWYWQPDGPRPWPVVLVIHGGPESQTRVQADPVVQFLVNRGYGVLAPNVRGSTGYGRTYHHLDDVRKRLDSVADAAAAHDWLVREGGADPRRIACYGGSYGGFMVLSLITRYPDRWAAAVDFVGIANFVTFLEHTGPYRRRLRESEYGSLEADGEFLREISPVNHVDRVTTPLFVVQGATDPRVPRIESDQFVERLRARGVPVEYQVYENEGHGLVRLENRLAAYTAMADFLDRYLG